MYGAQKSIGRATPKQTRKWIHRATRRHSWGPGKWLGKATKIGAYAALAYGAGTGLAGAKSAMAGPSVPAGWAKIGKGTIEAVIGGAQAGLSKRIEAQIAGDKGIYASGAGYQLPFQAGQAAELAALGHTMQTESQGQWIDANMAMKAMDQAFTAEQNALDRELTREIYAPNNGTVPGQTIPATLDPNVNSWYQNYSDKDLTNQRQRTAKGQADYWSPRLFPNLPGNL